MWRHPEIHQQSIEIQTQLNRTTEAKVQIRPDPIRSISHLDTKTNTNKNTAMDSKSLSLNE